ncbi:MAG: beta-galactosidase [Clostridia bacterium]|nr:beta-galactosidase [Clostridia bacterium]
MSSPDDLSFFLHGGDYNPDQWLDRPDILEADLKMMKKAHVNCVSLGIFAWSALEKQDGEYDFGWLGDIVDRLYENGIYTDLATPSGARPAWMAEKYPTVLRTDEQGRRRLFGERHNHCLTSPDYRRKVREMDMKLSERFGSHPGVIMWHIGNEFSGDCFCPLCAAAFRQWLKNKYGTVEDLNRRWWTSFWSQRYSSFDEIDPPSPRGEMSNPSMRLDWRRFSTDQCASFIRNEKEAIRTHCPDKPVTVNMMWSFWDYDYSVLAKEVDLISWDCYPRLRAGNYLTEMAEACMNHDYMRSLKGRPFLLMESSPSKVNWHSVNQLKRPGMQLTTSLLSVFCGSDSVMYFQWRKGRGGSEAFHGAVVGHDGRDDTRVFRDVVLTGEALERISALKKQPMEKPKALIVLDQQSRWASSFVQTGLRDHMDPVEAVRDHYRALFKMGIRADVRDSDADLTDYSLVVLPETFMFRDGFAQRLREYVNGGGKLLVTCFTGIVDGDDLCHLGGTPHGLTDVLGVRDPDLDALYPGEENSMVFPDGRAFPIREICEYPEEVTAGECLAVYGRDFYGGTPAFTENAFGKGLAWYLAGRTDEKGLDAVYARVAAKADLKRSLDEPLPEGVVAVRRGDMALVCNLGGEKRELELSVPRTDLLSCHTSKTFALKSGACLVLDVSAEKEGTGEEEKCTR